MNDDLLNSSIKGIKGSAGENKPELKSGFIILIYFFIKSLRIEPCVDKRKSR